MQLHPSLVGAIAAIFVVGLASALTSSPAPQHDHVATASGFATPAAPADQSKHLTLAGCLMRHKDVPATDGTSQSGRSGYLLVAVRTVSHHQNLGGMRSNPTPDHASPPHAHDAPQTTAGGPAVTAPLDSSRERIADSLMFKLAGVPLEQLSKMNGRRVQVAGHIDATTVVDTDRQSSRRPTDDLDAATFVVMSIDAVDGMCPKR